MAAQTALDARQLHDLLLKICDAVEANEAYFCELDSQVGDGDHGLTMTRGFRCVREAINPDMAVASLFSAAARALSANMGGAIGPIYGALLGAFAKETAGAEQVGLADFAGMFARGLADIKVIAEVTEGQKTMVDALSPAVRALGESAAAGDTLEAAFQKAADAAEQGAQSTVEMVARKGRAKFLLEKSVGHRDAGASSLAVIIGAIYYFVKEAGHDEKAQK